MLEARGEKIDWCVVGEPSSTDALGDTVKIGRRGSLSGKLTVHGIQGHVAYPHLADNPVHAVAPALAELAARVWDKGNEYFQPTSFQVSNITAGTGAPNVIPGELKARFNIRFSTEQTVEKLQQTITEILNRHKVNYTLEWFVSGLPFFTPPGELSAAVERVVKAKTGRKPELSTTGGTSDGRFIAPTGAQVVELGVINATHPQGERARARRRHERAVGDVRAGDEGVAVRLKPDPHRSTRGSGFSLTSCKFTTSAHAPSTPSEIATHHGIDRPRNVQSTLPHSPEPVSTFVTTSVTGMISSR